MGGPALAAHAFRAGWVDECHLFVAPILVGGGKQCFPTNVRLKLEQGPRQLTSLSGVMWKVNIRSAWMRA
ncbi:MAG: dihydrofolate reductase family protein [Pseudonocardiaceae bacterium]